MAGSLSNLDDNLSEGIQRTKLNTVMIIKKYENEDLNIKIVSEYVNVKDDLIVCKCLCCNKNHQKRLI